MYLWLYLIKNTGYVNMQRLDRLKSYSARVLAILEG